MCYDFFLKLIRITSRRKPSPTYVSVLFKNRPYVCRNLKSGLEFHIISDGKLVTMHLNEGLDECLVKALVIACLQKLYTTKRKNNVLTGRLAC